MNSKNRLLLVLGGLVVVYVILLRGDFSAFDFGRQGANPAANATQDQVDELQPGSEEKFDYLASQKSNKCSLLPAIVMTYSDDRRIQGSCCQAMDLHRYQEQVSALRAYSDIPQIPIDPYDIPASLAKELFGYQRSIQLSDAEQAIYDGAVRLSDEGGPCCCKCWRWDAFQGLANFLIRDHGFDSPQIAEVWDQVDGCGGAGHEHG